jgi:hypothetical protein
MAKKSQIDRAIEQLEGEIAVLEAAKARLIAQRDAQQAAKVRPT